MSRHRQSECVLSGTCKRQLSDSGEFMRMFEVDLCELGKTIENIQSTADWCHIADSNQRV